MDVSMPVGRLEGVGHIATLQHGVEIRSSTLAEEVGVVSWGTNADGSGRSCEGVAEVVGLPKLVTSHELISATTYKILKLVSTELVLILNHHVVRRL